MVFRVEAYETLSSVFVVIFASNRDFVVCFWLRIFLHADNMVRDILDCDANDSWNTCLYGELGCRKRQRKSWPRSRICLSVCEEAVYCNYGYQKERSNRNCVLQGSVLAATTR